MTRHRVITSCIIFGLVRQLNDTTTSRLRYYKLIHFTFILIFAKAFIVPFSLRHVKKVMRHQEYNLSLLRLNIENIKQIQVKKKLVDMSSTWIIFDQVLSHSLGNDWANNWDNKEDIIRLIINREGKDTYIGIVNLHGKGSKKWGRQNWWRRQPRKWPQFMLSSTSSFRECHTLCLCSSFWVSDSLLFSFWPSFHNFICYVFN